MFPTDYSIAPGPFARAIEERGFESFWVPEHSHFPVSEMTPGRDSGGLPNMYYDVVDPFVALAMAAQATERIRLGTSICLVVQRDPIQTAKLVASLDALCGGRFDFGTRLRLMKERIGVMKQLWTQEKAEFDGEFVKLAPSFAWPKPAQKPHPPIHVAANAPKGLGRVVDYGDGWFPMPGQDAEAAIFSQIPELHRRLEAAGRDPKSVEISSYWTPPDEGLVARARETGVDRVIFMVDPLPEAQALGQLDELAAFVKRCEA
jgi:alkanesulfonate monooxygenase SsuD/methylene tetrahydromethanopterin reductase-like flavin-dependent oxidoreductase (luciferase family)